jgi:hypothetical protein
MKNFNQQYETLMEGFFSDIGDNVKAGLQTAASKVGEVAKTTGKAVANVARDVKSSLENSAKAGIEATDKKFNPFAAASPRKEDAILNELSNNVPANKVLFVNIDGENYKFKYSVNGLEMVTENSIRPDANIVNKAKQKIMSTDYSNIKFSNELNTAISNVITKHSSKNSQTTTAVNGGTR